MSNFGNFYNQPDNGFQQQFMNIDPSSLSFSGDAFSTPGAGTDDMLNQRTLSNGSLNQMLGNNSFVKPQPQAAQQAAQSFSPQQSASPTLFNMYGNNNASNVNPSMLNANGKRPLSDEQRSQGPGDFDDILSSQPAFQAQPQQAPQAQFDMYGNASSPYAMPRRQPQAMSPIGTPGSAAGGAMDSSSVVNSPSMQFQRPHPQASPQPMSRPQQPQQMNTQLSAGSKLLPQQMQALQRKLAEHQPQQQVMLLRNLAANQQVGAADLQQLQQFVQQQHQQRAAQSHQAQQQQPAMPGTMNSPAMAHMNQPQQFRRSSSASNVTAAAQTSPSPQLNARRTPQMTPQVAPQQAPPSSNAPSVGGAVPNNAQRSETFVRQLSAFMAARNSPINPNPMINGYRINLLSLFTVVLRLGGSQRVRQQDMWRSVAAGVGFNSSTLTPDVIPQLTDLYMRTLLPFEENLKMRQQQGSIQRQVSQQASPPHSQGPQQTAQPMPQPPQPPQQQQQQISLSRSNSTSQSKNAPSPMMQRQSSSTSLDGKPANPAVSSVTANASAAPTPIPSNASLPGSGLSPNTYPSANSASVKAAEPVLNLPKDEKGRYVPIMRESHKQQTFQMLMSYEAELSHLRPEMPSLIEMGSIDVNALTLSLESKNHGEVKQALDKLSILTGDPRCMLILAECLDLITNLSALATDIVNDLIGEKKQQSVVHDEDGEPSLIEKVFAEHSTTHLDDIQFVIVQAVRDAPFAPTDPVGLSSDEESNSPEVQSKPHLPRVSSKTVPVAKESSETEPFGFIHYDILMDNCKQELTHLQPKLNSEEFFTTSKIERLLQITGIIRNFSFISHNHPVIAHDQTTKKFFFKTLHVIASRTLDLKSAKKTLDLMKDILVTFANIGFEIILDSASDAFVFLLFFLAFAPVEDPFCPDGKLNFGEYTAASHRYLGCAVDAFARVLPKDPPNRPLLESIIDGTCKDESFLKLLERYVATRGKPLRPNEFLTRVFGMCISVLPADDLREIPRTLEFKKPLLLQALLVADNMTGLIPDVKVDESGNETDSKPNRNLAMEWLEGCEYLGPQLLRTVVSIGSVSSAPFPGVPGQMKESNPFARVTQRCVSILRKLGQKAMQSTSPTTGDKSLPPGILPTSETLLGALMSQNMDKYVVGQICAFSTEGSEYLLDGTSKEM